MEINRDFVEEMDILFQEKGSRSIDQPHLEAANEIFKEFESLLMRENSSKEADEFVKKIADKYDLKNVLDGKSLNYEGNIRSQLGLVCLEFLKSIKLKIGQTSIQFTEIGLFFVPSHNNSRTRLKGELIFGATSRNIGDVAKMYIEDMEIPVVEGRGIVDIARTELRSSVIKAKISIDGSDYTSEVTVKETSAN